MPERAPITISLFDMFRIGPGPSSSHTVGPMRAAARFRAACLDAGVIPARLQVILQGSLSATGKGHGTDRAVLAGLRGEDPESCDTDALRTIEGADPRVPWGDATIVLRPEDVVLERPIRIAELPHPNTMVCRAFSADGALLREETWCSIGGGFVQSAENVGHGVVRDREPVHPFHDGASLEAAALRTGLTLGDVVLVNERAWYDDVDARLQRILAAFEACIARGLETEGELPGGLGVQRLAGRMHRRVQAGGIQGGYGAIAQGQAYAYAVSEENAAGGRVVTAPTNGAAGIFPGVLIEAKQRLSLPDDAVHRAIATGAAIAMIIKTHASLSGAEVGCQGEVGSATAMAAAALCEVLGGSPQQATKAAEIGLEHNLGLTCDPIKGLVQAPCIERNAMGVAKAWSAAQLALTTPGPGVVSLDKVIRVMRRTGLDMAAQYKETSEGGLAVAVPDC